MKFTPPPRTSAIGPLGKISHVERSIVCLHCQKAHNPGFMWSFSDSIRVCFTCYRVMGEPGRKRYERDAARGAAKQAGTSPKGSLGTTAGRKVIGGLAILLALISADAWLLHRPLTPPIGQPPVHAAKSRLPANR